MPIIGLSWGQDFEVTELSAAAFVGNASEVRSLLKAGVETAAVDKQGHTAVYYAIRAEQPDVAKLLFENQVPVFKDLQYLLNRVCRLGYADLIDPLVKAGARLDAQEGADRLTPLTAAVLSGSVQTARKLLERGVDRNMAGYEGFAPLQLAAKRADFAICSNLVEAGANINAIGTMNVSPLRLATFTEHTDIDESARKQVITLLKSKGARYIPALSFSERLRLMLGSL